MGKFDFEIDQDFVKKLEELSNPDEYIPQILDATIPILELSVKSELSKHRRTSQLVNSVKKTKASKSPNGGYFVCVRPTGKSDTYLDSKGVLRKYKVPLRNMEILAHLEYGTSKQTPKPIMTKAYKDSQSAVMTKLQEEFSKVVVEWV